MPIEVGSSPLNNIYRIRLEMVRVYREARAGRLDWSSASKAAFILTSIARLIEGMELEQRVEALEQLAREQPPCLPQPQ